MNSYVRSLACYESPGGSRRCWHCCLMDVYLRTPSATASDTQVPQQASRRSDARWRHPVRHHPADGRGRLPDGGLACLLRESWLSSRRIFSACVGLTSVLCRAQAREVTLTMTVTELIRDRQRTAGHGAAPSKRTVLTGRHGVLCRDTATAQTTTLGSTPATCLPRGPSWCETHRAFGARKRAGRRPGPGRPP
jgi:hypothetical protein